MKLSSSFKYTYIDALKAHLYRGRKAMASVVGQSDMSLWFLCLLYGGFEKHLKYSNRDHSSDRREYPFSTPLGTTTH